jgi:formylglycine-generating enzyme required for sulfatase activity
MRGHVLLLLMFVGVVLLGVRGDAQERARKPLRIEEIERLLRGQVSPLRIADIVEEEGVSFEVTAEVRERLRKAGADATVLAAVERASLVVARKKLEEERQRAEEERRKAAEERRQLEEEKREADAERKRQETEARRKAEEERKAEEAKRQEELQRRAEEERQQQAAAARQRQTGEMVAVPAGEFFLGCNEQIDRECYDDEKPGRRVFVAAFRIDKTEVTVAQYGRCVQAGGCSSPDTRSGCNYGTGGRDEHPVNCVDWQQADTYCRWAGKRLPTEAEWEKAARGRDGRIYPWGNQWDTSRANVGSGGTVAVGSYASGASPYGALDMSGNVWEWTADWYDGEHKYRSGRGGSWVTLRAGRVRPAATGAPLATAASSSDFVAPSS